MRVGVAIEETWDFFDDVFADLSANYQTSLFSPRTIKSPFFHERINKYLFRHDLQSFMRVNDVVFFEWASRLLAAATQLPKSCGIVTRLHRYEMYKWVEQINWDVVDKIILVSQGKKREFIEIFPEQASKIVVINEAVDTNKFQPTIKSFNGDIGILSHLTPRKRVYELILSFHELTQKSDKLRLHIAGGPHGAFGDYYTALRRIVRELGLENRVTFYGHVQNTWNWYSEIDIFISNSYSEGLQVAPMEAMASGCYCLAHRWDGADELLPESNLFYGERELQERILSYCEASDEKKQRWQARMRAIACEKFNLENTKMQIREVVEEVATSYSPSGSRIA